MEKMLIKMRVKKFDNTTEIFRNHECAGADLGKKLRGDLYAGLPQ